MNYVFTINDKYLEKLINYYKKIQISTDNINHKYLFKTDNLTITVFKTMKVMFQGEMARDEYNKWANALGIEIEKQEEILPTYENQFLPLRVIGSDEVGTGDFFGPIVVCAAYVTPNDYHFLDEMDIKDSKKISDKKIRLIGEKLVAKISHQVLITNNLKYNELIDKGFNMNKIKAYLHNHAFKKMVIKHPDYQKLILDQFCSEDNYYKYLEGEETVKDITFLTGAESIHKSVAVGAIIARYYFLTEFDKLSKEIGIELPKGAGPGVDAIAKVINLKYGREIFRKIAKLNFKNTEKII